MVALTPDRVDDDDRYRWEEPGAYEVVPGVFRVPLPLPEDGLKAVNVYVLDGDDGLTLVDAGWAIDSSRKALEDALASLSRTVADVRSVLVTHVHHDHYSQGVTLRRDVGSVLRIGEGERPSLEALGSGTEPDGVTQIAQLRAHGAVRLVDELRKAGWGLTSDPAAWEPPDEWIAADHVLAVGGARVRAVHTPGHTQGHLVYDDGDRGLAFTGDHVLPHITPSIGFESRSGPLPLRDYLDSLARVRALPDRMMLPAHGPVRSTTHTRVDELLAHHEERLEACEALLDGRARTAYEVARGLGWTRRARAFDTLDPVNRMLAVCETAAHLDVLALRGRCAREEAGGTVHYHRTAGSGSKEAS